MFDPSQILAVKIDNILEKWMDAVRKDNHVESAKNLSDTALSNSLTILLDQLVKALSHSQKENRTTIIDASVEHGTHRSKEGFDAAEIMWEYSILRRIIFAEIEPELLQCPPQEITRALDLINGVIEEAVSQCFKSYVEGRLEEIDRIQAQLSLTNQELKRLVRASQDSAPAEAIADPLRLQAILINLLSNAVRYTDEASIIIECLAESDQKWSLGITDTGIGIAPQDRERIFEPYSQAFAKDGRRDKESTGLGLAIVARLVKLLQGEIHLDSEKGVGSIFRVTFPLQIRAERTFGEEIPA